MDDLGFGPTTTIFFSLHTTNLVVEEWNVTSMIIPPIGAIDGVETSNLWIVGERLSYSTSASYKPSRIWPSKSLPVLHSDYKQNKAIK